MEQTGPDITIAAPPVNGWGRAARWGLLFAAALVFTLIQIQYSFGQYRLAQAPFYDDVVYFCDALGRLDIAYDRGLWPMLHSFISDPAHSPYSCVMALAGFLIFGIRDWAPYLMNSLLVLTLLACVDYFMRGARVWQRILVIGIVLCIPLSGIMVLDCRPDTAWGLAAAMAVLLPLRGPFIGASWRQQLAVGVWFAAALICKPPTSPLTVLSVAIAWIGATICDRLADPNGFSLKRIARAWLIAALPILFLAAPLYVLDAHQIAQYITSSIWGVHPRLFDEAQSWKDKLLFYVNGFAGDLMFHRQFYMIAIVLALGAILVMWGAIRSANAQRIRFYRMLALGITCFVTYLIPTRLGVTNPFFGAQFQSLMVLGMVIVLRMLLVRADRLSAKLFGIAVLLICAGSAVANATFIVPWSVPAGSSIALNNSRVIQSVGNVLLDNSKDGDKIFFTATGWLNCRTMQYVLRQDGTTVQTTDNALSADPQLFKARMTWADFVVAAESGVDEFDSRQPGLDFDQSLKIIQGHKDYHQIASVASGSGKQFFIFQRTRPAGPGE